MDAQFAGALGRIVLFLGLWAQRIVFRGRQCHDSDLRDSGEGSGTQTAAQRRRETKLAKLDWLRSAARACRMTDSGSRFRYSYSQRSSYLDAPEHDPRAPLASQYRYHDADAVQGASGSYGHLLRSDPLDYSNAADHGQYRAQPSVQPPPAYPTWGYGSAYPPSYAAPSHGSAFGSFASPGWAQSPPQRVAPVGLPARPVFSAPYAAQLPPRRFIPPPARQPGDWREPSPFDYAADRQSELEHRAQDELIRSASGRMADANAPAPFNEYYVRCQSVGSS